MRKTEIKHFLQSGKAANFGRKSYLKLFHSTGICQHRVLKDTESIPEAWK